LIAHSCGVKEPRELTREHVRIIENQSHSLLFSEVNPLPNVRPEFINLVGFETLETTEKVENTVRS